MHPDTFNYLRPTNTQMGTMEHLRKAAADYASVLEQLLPGGPDKTYVMRKLREAAMWANVAVTRHPDGAPRADRGPGPEDYPPDHPIKGDLGSVPL